MEALAGADALVIVTVCKVFRSPDFAVWGLASNKRVCLDIVNEKAGSPENFALPPDLAL